MGIRDAFHELLTACGLDNWMTMWHPTHKAFTLEFLSSVNPCNRNNTPRLRFHLNNVTHYFRYKDFCNEFDFEECIPDSTADVTLVNEF